MVFPHDYIRLNQTDTAMKRYIIIFSLIMACLGTFSGCLLREEPLGLSDEYIEFSADGGEQTVYGETEFFVTDITIYAEPGPETVENGKWLHVKLNDIDEDGYCSSVTISAGRNDTGLERRARLYVSNIVNNNIIKIGQSAN